MTSTGNYHTFTMNRNEVSSGDSGHTINFGSTLISQKRVQANFWMTTNSDDYLVFEKMDNSTQHGVPIVAKILNKEKLCQPAQNVCSRGGRADAKQHYTNKRHKRRQCQKWRTALNSFSDSLESIVESMRAVNCCFPNQIASVYPNDTDQICSPWYLIKRG